MNSHAGYDNPENEPGCLRATLRAQKKGTNSGKDLQKIEEEDQMIGHGEPGRAREIW